MRREAYQTGLHLSVRELLSILGSIQETLLPHHHGGKGRPSAQRMLTDTAQSELYIAELFGIQRYVPAR